VPLIYAIASYFLFLAMLPVLLTHPKLRHGLRQRLGFYRRLPPKGVGPRIWLHGASAGDLLALKPILDGLRQRLPQATLLVSTLTNSGRLMARERLKSADAIVYLPYDLPGPVRRAVRELAPDLLVLEYTEIWPNLIRAAKAAGARIALTNGRFSPRTFGSYRLLFWLIGNPLRAIDLFLMRGEDEAERALLLGAPRERLLVTGNTKFVGLSASALATAGDVPASLRSAIGEGRPLLIAGSTHEGEESLLLSVFARLRASTPSLRLVLAPRYIDRAPRILTLARERGFVGVLRSQVEAASPPSPGSDVIVLDTIGELAFAYQLATLVFVGGSFTPRGGQNILEPAAAGKPVLFGPNMENFADSVQVLLGRGGLQVKDETQLGQVLQDLLAQPERIAELGSMARSAVSSVSGASQRDVDELCKLLGQAA
jgi:3-deoxy-D-manno-octulosonic-acid transferase